MLAVLVASLLARAAGTASGWFYADDFAWFAIAGNDGFMGNVTHGEGGHIAWVQNALVWAFAQRFAYSWPAAVILMLSGYLVVAVLFGLLLHRLWGPRRGVVAVFAITLLMSSVASSYTWFSQAMLFTFLAAPSLLVAHGVDRALTGRTRWLMAPPVAFAFALSCSERALIMAPLLSAIVWLVRRRQGLVRPRRFWVIILTCGVAAGAFVAVYLSVSDLMQMSDSRPLDLGDRIQFFARGIGVAITSMVGGPWQIDATSPPAVGYAGVAQFLTAAAIIATVVAVGVARAGRWVLLIWMLALVYAVADVALIVYGRAGGLGVVAVHTVRYFTDLAFVTGLALAATFLTKAPASARWSKLRQDLERQYFVVVAGGVALLIAAVSANFAQYRAWSNNPARDYFTSALTDTRAVRDLVLVDSQVPKDVMPPLLTVNTLTRRVLVLYDGAPRFDTPAPLIGMLGPDGHVHPAVVDGGVRAEPDEAACGQRVSQDGEVELDGELFDWEWLIRIDYSADESGTAVAVVGEDRIEFEVQKGVATVFLPYTGEVDSLAFEPSDAALGLCVAEVAIGEPRPDLERGVEAWNDAAGAS